MAQTDSDVTDGIVDPQQALVELAQCTLVSAAEEDLWRDAVQILQKPMQVDCVAALRYSEDRSGFELVAGAGVEESLLGTRVADAGAGTSLDTVVTQDEPLVIVDTGTEERFLPSPVASHHDCKSGLSVAIRHNDTLWGVCEFYWHDSHVVGEEHVDFVSNVVVLLGQALGRIERDQRNRSRREQVQNEFRRFFLLVENAKDMIGMSDLDGLVSYLNPAGCRLVGLGEGEAVGRPVEDFLPADESRRFFGEIVPQVRSTGSWEGHLEVAAFDPPMVHDTEASVLLLHDPQTDEPAGYATILRDVSEQRRLRDQLRQSQKLEALGLLSGGVAHDFNNHLTVIKGYSELLLASTSEAEPKRQQIEKILHVSDKAHLLANQLLAFSRRKVREPRVIDLNRALDGLHDMLRSLIGENIVLECVTADEPEFVEADPSDIEQAILNLAVNARDAIEGKGTITIRTRTIHTDPICTGMASPAEMADLERAEELGDDPVMLEVRDTGKGMTAEVIEQVFDPFFTTKAAFEGTGLGLATVYRIVTDAGGDIAITSQPGCGTSFKVFFPRAAPPVEQTRDSTFEAVDLEGDEVIMVVEDDPDVLEFITEVLHRSGYDAIASSDGRKAIEVLDNYHDSIDAVICDVVLPHVSTSELRSELVDRYDHIPFLMTSGYADLEQFRHDQTLCDLPFIAKPMSPSALLSKLRTLLDQTKN